MRKFLAQAAPMKNRQANRPLSFGAALSIFGRLQPI
jgi:hypothetical protein